jgi:hypothetical protein
MTGKSVCRNNNKRSPFSFQSLLFSVSLESTESQVRHWNDDDSGWLAWKTANNRLDAGFPMVRDSSPFLIRDSW